MNYIGKFITNFKEFYNEINSATLTGAIDVIVIKQADQTYLCSPFHVRFGKLGVLRSKEKIVDIEINGEPVDIHMKLGDNGEAFFVEELQDDEDRYNLPGHLATSPIPEINMSLLASEIHRLKNKQSKAWSEQETTQQTNVVTSDEIRSEYMPTLEQVLVEVPQCDRTTDPMLASFNGISYEEKTKKSDSKRRRARRRAVNSRTNAQVSKLDDISLDVLDGSNLDEFSLYDDEFGRDDDRGQEDEDDERGSLEEELANLNEALVRSNSLPIPGSFAASNLLLSPSGSIPPPPPPTLKNIPTEFHPFSDGEMSPFPCGSPKKQFERPSSPKSDTEYEISKTESNLNQSVDTSTAEVSWQWGELPQVSRKISNNSHRSSNLSLARMDNEESKNARSPDGMPTVVESNKSGVFQNVLTLLKKEENIRKDKNLEKGIYLDDLNPDQLDPKVAELYFPKPRSSIPLKRISDDETESGNGPSLPHSPHSGQDEVESHLDQRLSFDERPLNECLDKDTQTSRLVSPEVSSFPTTTNLDDVQVPEMKHPLRKLFSKCELSLCGGDVNEFDWQLFDEQKFDQNRISYDAFIQNPTQVLKNPSLVFKMEGKCFNWQVASCMLVSSLAYGKSLPDPCVDALIEQHMHSKKKANRSSWWSWRRSYADPSQSKPDIANAAASPSLDLLSNKMGSSNRPDQDSSGTDNEMPDDERDSSQASSKKYRKFHYRKVLRLTSKDIDGLNLQEGSNEAVFSVTTAYQGTTRCKCHVYLWNHDDKIIISDIDGTITKSDVLGHILPILGKDWAQSGVANLFTKIKENGYKLLYLSARAIGQAKITREYLKSVRQGDLCLPDGPLLLSPTSLISAFHREVIEKKPEEFKISCLRDIQALFPQNPFYAGFGNKINDTWAYRAVDIPLSRIFTINHRGELKLELIQTFQSSYTRLSDVVDQMFPPLEAKSQNDFLSEFSTFNYWRDTLPDIPDEQDARNEESNVEPQPTA